MQPFWWLLAPPLLALVVAWHRQRRRKATIPSLFAWDVHEERRAEVVGAGRTPLRASLVLQALAVIASVFALAGPRFGSERQEVSRLVFVTARSGDDATRALRALLPTFDRTDRITLVDARGDVAPLRVDTTPHRLRAELDGLVGTSDAEVAWERFDRVFTHVDRTAAVDVFILAAPNERVPESVRTLATNAARSLTVHGVGPPKPDLAVTATRFHRDESGMGATIRASSTRSADAEATIRFENAGGTEVRFDVIVPADGSVRRTFDLGDAFHAAETVSVHLEADGAHGAAPVTRTIASDTLEPFQIAFVGAPIDAIGRWAAAADNVEVTVVPTPRSNDAEARSDFDLWILHAVDDFSTPESGSVLWLGSVPPDLEAEPWRDETVADLVRVHDVVAPVGTAHELTVERWRPMRAFDDADVLASYAGRPLIQARIVDRRAEVVTAFASEDSDWYESTGFATVLEGVLRWIDLERSTGTVPFCMVGRPCTVPSETRSVTDPDGRVHSAPERRAFHAWWIPTVPGVHHADVGGTDRTIHVDPPPPGAVGAEHPMFEGEGSTGRYGPGPEVLVALALLAAGLVAGASERRPQPRRIPLVAVSVAVFLLGTWVAWIVVSVPLGWTLPESVVLVSRAVERSPEARSVVQERIQELERRAPTRLVPNAHSEAAERGMSRDTPFEIAWASAMLDRPNVDQLVWFDAAPRIDGVLAAVTRDAADRVGELVYVAAPRFAAPEEIVVEDLHVLGGATPGSSARLVADLVAPGNVSGTIDLTAENETVYRGRVDLEAGRSVVTIDIDRVEKVPSVYTVRAASDSVAPVSFRSVVLGGGDPTRVAIVTHEDVGWPLLFAQLLEAHDVDVALIDAEDVPERPEAWSEFDAVVLQDLPAIAMSSAQQEAIRAWVERFGGGLLILGGERAFGPGGYHLTPLDEVSPVASEIPMERPDVAIVFVLDRSGSMVQAVGDVTRMDIAREATWEAIGLLDPRSRVGIVVFDSSSTLLHPLRTIDDPESVRRALDTLTAGGGTALQPALALAHEAIRGADDVQRHMVVMTDGLTRSGDFDTVMDAIEEDDITVSTIAIGRGAAYPRLRLIADQTGGTFYESVDFRLLPSIMAQEILLLTSEPVLREPSAVAWADEPPAFVDDDALGRAAVDGYVRTEAKEAAQVHATAGDGDPLLASWRYGLGRVVAWTSHGAGPWSVDALREPSAPRLWAQAVRWASRSATTPGLDVAIATDGTVRVEATGPDGEPLAALDLVVHARQDAGTTSGPPPTRLTETAHGTYEGRIELGRSRPGTYQVDVGPRSGSFGSDVAVLSRVVRLESGDRFPRGRPEGVRAWIESIGGTFSSVSEDAFVARGRSWSGEARPSERLGLLVALAAFLVGLSSLYGVRLRRAVRFRSAVRS